MANASSLILNFCSNYFLELSCLHLLQLATLLAGDRSVAGLIFILASDKSCTHVDGDDVDWDTDDELEIENFTLSSSANPDSGEGNLISDTQIHISLKIYDMNLLCDKFIGTDEILACFSSGATFSARDSPPEQCSPQEQQQTDSDLFSSDYDGSFLDSFSDLNSSDDEVIIDPTSEVETKLMSLVKMGYSMAIERCGIDSSLVDFTDFISAAQISKAEDGHLPLEEMVFFVLLADIQYFDCWYNFYSVHVWSEYPEKSKRKLCESSLLKRKRIIGHGNQIIGEDADAIHLPNPMVGFGTPDLCQIYQNLPKAAAGPPYFYYENVALTRKGVWSTMSCFLYDMKPEFVDPKYFCAAARKRGYVHNLPVKNRFPLVPLPPQTIFDAFPMTSGILFGERKSGPT
ncbi:DNA (cytosine-5)-methyltransferase DRM2-like [Rosa chinensis]|uniref:DNA (cytosine-5)-methyltransferase DRM2-like n=1 Tax=Rosa chinensis TaxID=74649 RepID=UPI001AD93707|nr:DNA (cytosine-5)-methyltransferase DRM2-like [Rosa chinensis]